MKSIEQLHKRLLEAQEVWDHYYPNNEVDVRSINSIFRKYGEEFTITVSYWAVNGHGDENQYEYTYKWHNLIMTKERHLEYILEGLKMDQKHLVLLHQKDEHVNLKKGRKYVYFSRYEQPSFNKEDVTIEKKMVMGEGCRMPFALRVINETNDMPRPIQNILDISQALK